MDKTLWLTFLGHPVYQDECSNLVPGKFGPSPKFCKGSLKVDKTFLSTGAYHYYWRRLPYNIYCVGRDVKHCTIHYYWRHVQAMTGPLSGVLM